MAHGGASRSAHHHSEADVTDLTHSDTAAIHDNVAGEINAITAKTSVAASDVFIIEDSAASNAKKKVTGANLPAAGAAAWIESLAAHDNTHNTNANNADATTDQNVWTSSSITVSAGDMIVVRWGWSHGGMSTADDMCVYVELDNGTQQIGTDQSAGLVNNDSGFCHTEFFFYIESTSQADMDAWAMHATDDINFGSSITENTAHLNAGESSAGKRQNWDTDATNDFTGTCTLKGWTDASTIGTTGEYYEEYVIIEQYAKVT